MNPFLDETFLRLMDNLCTRDDETNGHPQLSEGDRTLALSVLERFLLDRQALNEHTRRLQKRFGRTLRHKESLMPDRTDQIVFEGIEVLSTGELAVLLLNPIAMRVLSIQIVEALLNPEVPLDTSNYWLDRMSDLGRQMMQEDGILRKPQQVVVPAPEKQS
jgi:hypothetical protein